VPPRYSPVNGIHKWLETASVKLSNEESRMVKIVVRRFGGLKEGFTEKVLEILRECYNRIDANAVGIVDLYLFEKSSAMNAFVSEEKRKLGIKTSAFEESYYALHDAWHGTPRIMVAYDMMSALPEPVRTGSLRHEAAHTMLHGSLEFYSFPFSASLLRLEEEGVIPRRVARDLLHLISIAAKDFEATRLLYDNQFVEDQVAFNKHILEPSGEDREAWELAEKDKPSRLLVLVSILKTICCAAPLLKNHNHGGEISESIKKSLSYLPEGTSESLLGILDVATKFGRNTHENVDLLLGKTIDELVTGEKNTRTDRLSEKEV